MAALEAMSAGVPIIATKAHGVVELIDNVGLLVPWKDGIMEFDPVLYEQ
jgi:glycosyltransferase involved in cell wall biosynthesis